MADPEAQLEVWKERAEKAERQCAYQQQTIDFLNASLSNDEEQVKKLLDDVMD